MPDIETLPAEVQPAESPEPADASERLVPGHIARHWMTPMARAMRQVRLVSSPPAPGAAPEVGVLLFCASFELMRFCLRRRATARIATPPITTGFLSLSASLIESMFVEKNSSGSESRVSFGPPSPNWGGTGVAE